MQNNNDERLMKQIKVFSELYKKLIQENINKLKEVHEKNKENYNLKPKEYKFFDSIYFTGNLDGKKSCLEILDELIQRLESENLERRKQNKDDN